MTERSVPRLYQGQRVVNEDGTLEHWFVDAWNDLVDRSGGEDTDIVGNIINGTQSIAEAAAAQQSANNIVSGAVELEKVRIANRGDVAPELDSLGNSIIGVGGFTLSKSPSSAYGSRVGAGAVTTNSVTITPSGGVAPYTYAWTKVSGDTFTVTSPSAASTTFSITVAVGENFSAVYRGTVTDSTGGTPLVATIDIPVSAAELS